MSLSGQAVYATHLVLDVSKIGAKCTPVWDAVVVQDLGIKRTCISLPLM